VFPARVPGKAIWPRSLSRVEIDPLQADLAETRRHMAQYLEEAAQQAARQHRKDSDTATFSERTEDLLRMWDCADTLREEE
jgi:hypothetical protein